MRGANVAAGYWQGKELKPVLNEEGWFRTGDLGELDADGNLYFKGRKKNVIVTREGMNIYPEDLEAALRQQPEVRDCVVVGLEQGGNAEPCAVLLLRDSADPELWSARRTSSLRSFSRCGAGWCGRSRTFPAPRRRSRKTAVIQAAAQQQFAAGMAPQRSRRERLAILIARITGRNVGAPAADAKLEGDLNLSSMDRVELMSALEDRYQIDLNEANFANVKHRRRTGALAARSPQKSAQSGYRYPRWAQRWPITWIREGSLLPADVAGDADHGAPEDRRAREPARRRRAVAGQMQPRDLYRRGIRAAWRSRARLRRKLAVGMWGEMLWGMWRPPRRHELVRALVAAGRILPGGRAIQCVSLAAAVRGARELCLCR